MPYSGVPTASSLYNPVSQSDMDRMISAPSSTPPTQGGGPRIENGMVYFPSPIEPSNTIGIPLADWEAAGRPQSLGSWVPPGPGHPNGNWSNLLGGGGGGGEGPPGRVGTERPNIFPDGGGTAGTTGFKTLEQMLAAGDISAPLAAIITGQQQAGFRGVGQGIAPLAAGATGARGPQITGFTGDMPFASAQTLANMAPSARQEFSNVIGRLGGRAEDQFNKGLQLSRAPGSRTGYQSSSGFGGAPSSRGRMWS